MKYFLHVFKKKAAHMKCGGFLVERAGFEPAKAMLADLQSAPFGQLGNLSLNKWQGRRDSNPQHADLESAALPLELHPYQIRFRN